MGFPARDWLIIDTIMEIFIFQEDNNLSDSQKNFIQHFQLLHLHHPHIFRLYNH